MRPNGKVFCYPHHIANRERDLLQLIGVETVHGREECKLGVAVFDDENRLAIPPGDLPALAAFEPSPSPAGEIPSPGRPRN